MPHPFYVPPKPPISLRLAGWRRPLDLNQSSIATKTQTREKNSSAPGKMCERGRARTWPNQSRRSSRSLQHERRYKFTQNPKQQIPERKILQTIAFWLPGYFAGNYFLGLPLQYPLMGKHSFLFVPPILKHLQTSAASAGVRVPFRTPGALNQVGGHPHQGTKQTKRDMLIRAEDSGSTREVHAYPADKVLYKHGCGTYIFHDPIPMPQSVAT